MKKPRHIYSVRRAKQNLLDAIRDECRAWARQIPMAYSTSVYAREAAVRDLIAAVRKAVKP